MSVVVRRQVRNESIKRFIIWTLVLAVVLLGAFQTLHSLFYRVARAVAVWRQLYQVRSWETLEGSRFIVKYRPEDAGMAHMVLNGAENIAGRINQDFGLGNRNRIPIIIYPSTEKLNSQFGWEKDHMTLGVYWGGVIRVLSPRAWVAEDDPEKMYDIYSQQSPMVHEYTHLALDYKTDGNYPQWFTEGLAQYEEYKMLDYEWIPPRSSLEGPLYSWSELESFVELPNEAKAYRQSFLAVMYIDRTYGEEAVFSIVQNLAEGKTFDEAVESTVGVPIDRFRAEAQSWIAANLFYLEKE